MNRFATWRPREGHKLLEQDLAEVVIEAREGGRWYESIVLAWHLDPQFAVDPDHGARAGMRQAVGGDGGWSHLLALYRDAA